MGDSVCVCEKKERERESGGAKRMCRYIEAFGKGANEVGCILLLRPQIP